MPAEYVFEMIADWWSFSFGKGDLEEIFDWYAEHGNENMLLHPNTRKLVDKILDSIERELTRVGNTYNNGTTV